MNAQAVENRNLLVSMAAFVIVIAGMKASSEILVPFFTSVFLAFICTPPIVYLKRLKIPHGLAVAIVVILIAVVGIMLGAIVGNAMSQFVTDIPVYQERMSSISEGFLSWLVGLGIELDIARLRTVIQVEQVFPVAGILLASLGNLMTNAFVILLTVIFILAEEFTVEQKLKSALPSWSKASDSIYKIAKAINQYIAIKAAISVLTGFLVWIILIVLGVDYPILWAVLAMLFNFIPTFGSLIAAVPAVLLALVQLGPVSALYAAIGYVAVNMIVGNVIEPRIMGKGLGLSALVVLISLIFWGWVLGPVGMLLSVPLTVMLKIGLEMFPDTRWMAVMLGPGGDEKSRHI